MGADIIKVKPPSDLIGFENQQKAYENVPKATLAERIAHVVKAAFDGKRIIIFSGGSAKDKEGVLNDVRGVHEGGGFGSIIGRNTFQRQKKDALQLLDEIMNIYKS